MNSSYDTTTWGSKVQASGLSEFILFYSKRRLEGRKIA